MSSNPPFKKLRICHVVSTLDVGGMENGVVNLCNGHDRSLVEPSICCLKRLGPMADRLLPDVKVSCLGFAEGRSPLRPLAVSSVFRRERPDIVHTHGWGGGAWDGVIGARLADCPVVINGEHGLVFARWHQVLLQRMVAGLCSNTFAVSQALKEKVAVTLGISPARIKVITNGVDLRRFSLPRDVTAHRLREEAGIGREDKVICCIGSLKKEKNQSLLLRALAELSRLGMGEGLRLLLVGEGPDREMLEAYVRREGLTDQVRLLGRREDVPCILAGSDIFVSTSRGDHEGLSNVILEAMAAGLPVIATRSVGTEEIVLDGKTGLLVAPDDVAALADGIKSLLMDGNKAASFGKAGRAVVVEKYSLERMIREYEEEYQRLYLQSMK